MNKGFFDRYIVVIILIVTFLVLSFIAWFFTYGNVFSCYQYNLAILGYIGSIIGGFCTLYAVVWTITGKRLDDKRILLTQKILVLKSIYSELSAIQPLILIRKKEVDFNLLLQCSNVKDYKFAYFSVRYNYFSIYDGLTSQLGVIDNVLVPRIIRMYINLKAFYEDLAELQMVSVKAIEFQLNSENLYTLSKYMSIHKEILSDLMNNHLPGIEKELPNLLTDIDLEVRKLSGSSNNKE